MSARGTSRQSRRSVIGSELPLFLIYEILYSVEDR